jgi:large subunit ribosomal protein L34
VVSTLIQSPESRRYGCDPSIEPGGRAGYQRDTKPIEASWGRAWPTGTGNRVNHDVRCSKERVVAKGKRTFQPNNRRRARVHGFRLRMRTRAGRAIVSNRRGKGRRSLTA